MANLRVLVVGAGHNGLVAAIHLARAGIDVSVLEQAHEPGGATRSQACTLPGFVHDLHAGFVPMTAASPAMQELQLEDHGVSWVNPPAIAAHPFDDGSAIVLHRDVEATVASLGAAGAGWRAAMDRLLPVADPLAHAILAPLPPVRPVLPLLRGLGPDLVVWARRLLSSVQALGLELFDGDRRATAWLAASAQHSGLPPTTTVSGAFGMLLQIVGHRHGWPLPRGGMGRVVDALVTLATGAGARVRCDAPVDQILVRGERVRGVRLRGGEELGADAVITTITAQPLPRMLPTGALPGRLEQRLRAWRYSTGPFKIDYALSGPVPWTAEEARTTAVVHVAGELEALDGAAQAGQRGEVPQRPALVVGQQSLHDPSRAPAGAHTLYVYGHVPSRYDARRRGGRRADRGAAGALRARLRATSCWRARRGHRTRPRPTIRASSAATWAAGPTSSTSSWSSARIRRWPAIARRCAACTSRAPRRTRAAPSTASADAERRARCCTTAGCGRGGHRDQAEDDGLSRRRGAGTRPGAS